MIVNLKTTKTRWAGKTFATVLLLKERLLQGENVLFFGLKESVYIIKLLSEIGCQAIAEPYYQGSSNRGHSDSFESDSIKTIRGFIFKLDTTVSSSVADKHASK